MVMNVQLTLYFFLHSLQLQSPPRQINEFNSSTHMKSILLSKCVCRFASRSMGKRRHAPKRKLLPMEGICSEIMERAGHNMFLRNDDLQTRERISPETERLFHGQMTVHTHLSDFRDAVLDAVPVKTLTRSGRTVLSCVCVILCHVPHVPSLPALLLPVPERPRSFFSYSGAHSEHVVSRYSFFVVLCDLALVALWLAVEACTRVQTLTSGMIREGCVRIRDVCIFDHSFYLLPTPLAPRPHLAKTPPTPTPQSGSRYTHSIGMGDDAWLRCCHGRTLFANTLAHTYDECLGYACTVIQPLLNSFKAAIVR